MLHVLLALVLALMARRSWRESRADPDDLVSRIFCVACTLLAVSLVVR